MMSPELVLGLTLGLGTAAALSIAAVVSSQKDSAEHQAVLQHGLAPITVLGAPSTDAMVDIGQGLYAANCASCHGAELEGEPNWRQPGPNGQMPAPPHDASGHTWHHPDQDLIAIIKHGIGAVQNGRHSRMPSFDEKLGDAQIEAILAFIKSSWPDHARRLQQNVTREAGSNL
ncbi:c-type cytochrome [Profundibacterium mesophilum]|uniref:Cbb3-type cytochrome c oxidase subunit n=1 Tax=Profundibacterium mesophilum KAUST100406-0324 TaxID=1037889 RepID=A0A921NQ77_9RHOB|nr:cytochrome c [Profundibacterium mesophilum]KAF0675107.1 Cbb3-type cytochrome c oxidase subunit [Profundibacterium mesophilum KAUST100406-0324]